MSATSFQSGAALQQVLVAVSVDIQHMGSPLIALFRNQERVRELQLLSVRRVFPSVIEHIIIRGGNLHKFLSIQLHAPGLQYPVDVMGIVDQSS